MGPGAAASGAAARQPRGRVLALWLDYLRRRDASDPNAMSLWAARDRGVDLQQLWLYGGPGWSRGVRVRVDSVARASGDSVYVVRSLFTRDDSAGVARPPIASLVYAVRDRRGTWRLTNALPFLTAGWTHSRAGAITFVYPAAHAFDAAAAERSARFVDSAARAIGETPPVAAWYYLAGAPAEVTRILGLGGAPNAGGRVFAESRIVIGGQPTSTEWNPHDLAHVAAAPTTLRAPKFLDEGVATWLGGWRGRPFAQLVRELDADLAAHPGRTLDSLMAPHEWRDTVSYAGAGVLARMAMEAGGALGLRHLLWFNDGSPASVTRAAAITLGVSPGEVGPAWRRAVRAWSADSAAAPPP